MTKSKIDLAIKILIGALLAALIVIIAGSLNERVVKAGDTAPDFSITTDQGRKITATNFGGKVLVLHFWASWCAPCVEEARPLNEFQRKVADSGVVVLGVSIDTNESAYRKFISMYKIAFETARDPEANISSSYGTFKVPETYIIDRTGKVVQKVIGEGDWGDAAVNFVKSL
jgi:peroxiredoxin